MKKLIYARSLLVENPEEEGQEENPSTPPPSSSPPLGLFTPVPVLLPPPAIRPPKGAAKRASVIVHNVQSQVNIMHLSKWQTLIRKMREKLDIQQVHNAKDKKERIKDQVKSISDRDYRQVVREMKEKFPDSVSKVMTNEKRRQGLLESANRVTGQDIFGRTKEEIVMQDSGTDPTNVEMEGQSMAERQISEPTEQELALLDPESDEEEQQMCVQTEEDIDILLASDDSMPPSGQSSPDYSPQERKMSEEETENEEGRLEVKRMADEEMENDTGSSSCWTELPRQPELKITLVKTEAAKYKIKPKQEYVEPEYAENYPLYDITDSDDGIGQGRTKKEQTQDDSWVLPPNTTHIIENTVRKLMFTQTGNLHLSTVQENIEKNPYAQRAQNLLNRYQEGQELNVAETIELNAYKGHLAAYRIAQFTQSEARKLVLQTEVNTEVKLVQNPDECQNCFQVHLCGYKCKPMLSNSPTPIDTFRDSFSSSHVGFIMGLNKIVVQPPSLSKTYANLSRNPGETYDYPVLEHGLGEDDIRNSQLYRLITRRTEKINRTRGLFIIEFAESTLQGTESKCLIFHMICFLQIVKEATRFSGLTVIVALLPSDYLPGMPFSTYRQLKAHFWRYAYAGMIIGCAIGIPIWSVHLQSYPYVIQTGDASFIIDPIHNVATPEYFPNPLYTLTGAKTSEYQKRLKQKILKMAKLIHHYGM